MAIKCIDISEHQGNVDFKKVKASGVTHVILRSSYTGLDTGKRAKDSKFITYVTGAHNAGLKIGIYHFSQALNVSEAEKEAEYCLDVIKPYKSFITLPVFIDWEFNKRLTSTKAKKLGEKTCTDICAAFCRKVEAAGYVGGVYANTTTFNNYLNVSSLESKYKIWCAQYNTKCTLNANLYAWQYTSAGKVNGISGRVDMNYIYNNEAKTYAGDFPTLKKAKGEKIAATAEALAWPKGTKASKTAYPDGAPTAAFKEALKKAYPDRSKWGKAPAAGASCDVGVGTCVRTAGIDKDFGRGLDEQWKDYKNADIWEEVTPANCKRGDTIIYKRNDGGGHTCICLGTYIAEAALGNFYLRITNARSERLSKSGKKKLAVYRAKGTYTAALKSGDNSADVKRLQNFLNWCMGAGLTVDGIFGAKTEAAVKSYQQTYNLTVDGIFGAASLAKAKTVKK